MASIVNKIFKKKEKSKAPRPEVPTPEAKEEKKPTAARRPVRKRVLKGPWVSERARNLSSENKYVFLVEVRANKDEVKDEVERRYGVTVTSVRTQRHNRRGKRFRGQVGKGESLKKAVVALKPGEKIDIFPV